MSALAGTRTEGLGEPLVKAEEVAEYLGLHKATVYRLAGAPHGIPTVEMKGSLRFRPSDVRAYVERCLVSNQVNPTSKADRMLAATQVAERPTVPGNEPKPRRRGRSA
jgi:excisionase family DNA binding protein